MKRPLRIDIRSLILLLSVAACIATLLNCLWSAYRIERKTLIENALEANHTYSSKVASSIDAFLRDAQLRLRYSAGKLADSLDDPTARMKEVERMQAQDRTFDSIIIATEDGRVINTSPASLGVDGRVLKSAATALAREHKMPLVSDAYTSIAGNLVVFISSPIFSSTGKYLGFIGGAIHLQNGAVLNTLVSNHFYFRDAEIYVVDRQRRVLSHRVESRVGFVVGENRAVDEALRGFDGSLEITDTKGATSVAGYAPIPAAGWGIVSQQPLASVLAPLKGLLVQIVIAATPVALLGFGILWWLSAFIAHPLRQLAEIAATNGLIESKEEIARVSAWYFEVDSIRSALLGGIQSAHAQMAGLEQASQTDALTGLYNRRALNDVLEKFASIRHEVAIIDLDIDHFKMVNDTFGHDAGDVVLQRLAKLLRESCRSADLAFRVGGEEFLLLLPATSLHSAVDIAERLRRRVAQTHIEPAGNITISLGVTIWPRGTLSVSESLKEADELLYQAKRDGRNRTRSV